ncbi:hypothetical protein T07_6371 [Trichinella nelsoni]|uniref:Uncharacterized protein n=1 Tax=Trichinella nelsoni TaxID=6336 RepID=A0A0V0SAW4_9BILA|nr:hypothetical protein T07_6371 [Trichinella nelsoni]
MRLLCNDLPLDILFFDNLCYVLELKWCYLSSNCCHSLILRLFPIRNLLFLSNKVVDQCQNNYNENRANSQHIGSFTFVTASSLLRLIQLISFPLHVVSVMNGVIDNARVLRLISQKAGISKFILLVAKKVKIF